MSGKFPLSDAEITEHLARKPGVWQRLNFPHSLEQRFQQASIDAALALIGLAHKKISSRIFASFILSFSLAVTTALVLLLEPIYPQSYLFFLLPTLALLGIYSRLATPALLIGMLINAVWAQSLLALVFAAKSPLLFIYAWLWASLCLWLLANLFERIQREQFLLDQLLNENQTNEVEPDRQPLLVGLDSHTGLSNGLSFERALLVEWKRSARTQRPIALIFIQIISPRFDLANFANPDVKKLLAQLGEVLRSHARRPGDISAHLEKQRFVVLLAETELKNAHHVALKLRDALAAAQFFNEAGEPIQIGANLAVYSEVPEAGSLTSLDFMQDAWTTLDVALQDEINQVVCLG